MLLPAPAGPSMAMIISARFGRGAGRSRGRISLRCRRPRFRRLPVTRAGHGAQHRDPVIASRVHPAATRPRRHAGDGEAVLLALGARADRAQRVDDGLDPVGLLQAQLGRAVHPARAARAGGEQPEERQLVDQQRHLSRCGSSSRSARRCGSRARRPAPARSGCAEDADARAHPLEHVEQPGAARVQADAMDRQLVTPGRASRRR